MKQNMIALHSGVLFGVGLGLSQMTDRARVPGFLDFAGRWDPTLMLVLLGAVGVTIVTFRFVLRRPAPVLANQFHLPSRKDIDWQLLVGSGIFGAGWAIAGWCPAPGITALTLGQMDAVIYVAGMLAGTFAYRWWSSVWRTRAPAPAQRPVSVGN